MSQDTVSILRAALNEAATTLRRYEASHRAKNTDDSNAKAEVNADLAGRFEAILRDTAPVAAIQPAGDAVPVGYVGVNSLRHLQDFTSEGQPNSTRIYNMVEPGRGITVPVYAAPLAQASKDADAGEFPPLPFREIVGGSAVMGSTVYFGFTADQMRAYVLADRAARDDCRKYCQREADEAAALARQSAPSAVPDMKGLIITIQNAYIGYSGEHLDAGMAHAIAESVAHHYPTAATSSKASAPAGSIGDDAEFVTLLRELRNADQRPDTVAEHERSAFFALVAYIDASPAVGMVAAPFDFRAHLVRQAAWSEKTFGPGARTAGVCDHIRKELLEIEADPLDLREWIDVVILALDGAWRCGGKPDEIIAGIVAKQTKNEGRNWPDWRTADPNKVIEHDRSGESPAAPDMSVRDSDELPTDAEIIAACHSVGTDTEKSIYGFPELQVKTTVPGIRNIMRALRSTK